MLGKDKTLRASHRMKYPAKIEMPRRPELGGQAIMSRCHGQRWVRKALQTPLRCRSLNHLRDRRRKEAGYSPPHLHEERIKASEGVRGPRRYLSNTCGGSHGTVLSWQLWLGVAFPEKVLEAGHNYLEIFQGSETTAATYPCSSTSIQPGAHHDTD